MLDSLSSYADLASLMTSMYKKLQKIFTITDYSITVPFDIKNLSYFSLLKAKTLRQTKACWCWFDKASKDDKDAGTRLGTLRFLPYEIRQQIFQIVLEDYFEEQLEQQLAIFNRGRYSVGRVNRSILQITFRHCCCKREVPNVFDLRSYFGVWQATERPPMSLRLASLSIQSEFDGNFLACNTFHFTCPFTLQGFLDQLSPFKQRQLRSVSLAMFEYWVCNSDPLVCRDQWMAACQRLPPGLISVEMKSPYSLRDVLTFWTNRPKSFYDGQGANSVNRLATELLEPLFKKIARASPQAVISWTGRENLYEEDCAVLHAGLAELEPWSEEWHTYMDGRNV